MTAKGSVTSMILNDKLFDTVLDCCQKNGDIGYSNKEKMIITGKSFYGPQRNEGEIDFQVLLSENPCTIEVYEYCKRGIDRKFMERVIDALLPILGRDVNVKIEDLDRCGICKKRLKLLVHHATSHQLDGRPVMSYVNHVLISFFNMKKIIVVFVKRNWVSEGILRKYLGTEI